MPNPVYQNKAWTYDNIIQYANTTNAVSLFSTPLGWFTIPDPPATTFTDVETSGGTGVGLTINVTTDPFGVSPYIVEINNGGYNYTIGDVITFNNPYSPSEIITFTVLSTSTILDPKTELLKCNTSDAPVNFTLLPIGDYWDYEYKLYVIDSEGNGSTNNITIYAPDSHLINGQTGVTINNDYGSALIRVVDSTNYIAQFGKPQGTSSGDCITDLYVTNLNSCSPLHIQPTNSGNVLIGENGGVNVGIGTSTPTRVLDSRGTFNLEPNANTFLRFDGTLMEAQVGNSNNQLVLNRDNFGITDLKGSGGVNITNSTYSNSFNIGSITTLRENDKLVFSRIDNYVQGWYDMFNNRLKIGGGGYAPIYSSVTSTLHVSGDFRVDGTKPDSLYVGTNGNVGVQTSSPSSNFQVNQSSVGVGLISATGVTTSIWPYSYTGYTLVTGVDTLFSSTLKEGDTIQCTGITLTVAYILSQTSIYCFYNPLAVFGTYVGGTGLPYTLTSGQRFNVTSNGRIGIGTTTPTSNIDIFHGSRGDYTMRVRTKSEELGYKTPFELVTSNQGVANLTMGDPSTVGVGSASITLRGLNPNIHLQGDAASYYPKYVLSNNQGTTVWDNYANFGSGRYGMNFYTYHGFSFITPNYDKIGTVMMVDSSNNITFNGNNIRNSGFEVFGVGSNTEIARFSQSIYPISSPATGLTTSVGSGSYSAYTMVTTSVGESYFTKNVIPNDTIIVYSAGTSPMYITVNEVVNDNLLYGTHNPINNYFLGTGLTYYLGGTTRMVVKNNGNIGIGTMTPDSKLVIKGIDSSSSNYGLKVQNSGGTNNFVVSNDGFVGIGTSTPTAKLEIKSDSSSGNIVYPFSVKNYSGSNIFRISNENYYLDPNRLGVYSEIYDNIFNINLLGSSGQFKLNYGNSSFQMNPNAFGGNSTRFLFKTDPGGSGGESGIEHNTDFSGTFVVGETLNIGCSGTQTGTTYYGKYIKKLNFNNPNATFYPLIVLNGNSGFGTTTPTSTLDVNGTNGYNQLRLRTSFTPTGSTDTRGNVGDIAWDDNNFYWKTSTQWLRVSGQTF